jgi:ketosteroid isomerase-like protein
MTDQERANIATVRSYLAALSEQVTGEELGRFFHDRVEQFEYPNRLTPEGAKRDKAALLAGAESGKRVTEGQRYEVRTIVASGDVVAVEADWSCTLRVQLGKLAKGGTMRAKLAMFMELEGGQIRSLRNYDCFDPF